ncbi:MAG: class I SAM-dependent methyltransferase family protein [Candidatus Aenigmarchaeota archaeon]|nr:class I SAM-dependent methyltransferase family protein [Candidatus Aenigmarchaeota archaeon]
MSIEKELRVKLTEEELKKLVKSFDIIGSREKAVAIIEIPDELSEKKTLIAEAIMKVHKNVVAVLRKKSPRKGTFRLRKYELLLGEKNTEVLHKESGCRFLLDPRKVYFSVRESAERLRISEKVKENEKILVMFGGVAPYPIVIAKKRDVNKIYSIEINPKAHEYAIKNVLLNKVGDVVIPILGDVREICPLIRQKFDRILMPLPEKAYEFLDVALSCSKKGTIIHLYGVSEEKNLFDDLEKKVVLEMKKLNKKYKTIERRKVLPFGPRKWKVCLDIRIL